MRVFIRQRTSSKFLADREHWVADRKRALDFATSLIAVNAANRMNLSEVEIVLDFGKPETDVVLDVPDQLKQLPRLR
jgi:hypothetical protein